MANTPEERNQEREYLIDKSLKFSDLGRRMVQLMKEPTIDHKELMEMKSLLESIQEVIVSADTKAFEDLVDGLNKAIFALGSIIEEDFETEDELKSKFEAVLRGVMESKIACSVILRDYDDEPLAVSVMRDEREDRAKQLEMEQEAAREKARKDQQERALQESLERIQKRDEEFNKNKPKTTKKRKENVGAKPVSEEEAFARQMGLKMSTTKQINALFALADKFDSVGEHEKANEIDGLLKRLAEEFDLPEYQPEHSPGTPSWIAKDKWDKMKEVHELTETFKSFLNDPTMDKHNSLLDGISKFMKHTKEEGVIASSKTDIEKIAAFGDEPEDPSKHHLKEMTWDLEQSDKSEDKIMEAFIKAIEDAKDSVASAHAQGISMMGPEVQNTIKALFTLSKHMEDQKKWDRMNSASSKAEIFEKLAGIADKLDSVGATEEASMIDEFIEKQAKGKEKEQDPYDTKQHHSEQIREPKKPGKETKDRDGRKEHHVETYKDTGVSALSTRHCPEHVGVMLGRIGENTYQCALDGQVYNWETGWTDYDGNKHPGGSVAGQTPAASEYAIPHRIFDSREKA